MDPIKVAVLLACDACGAPVATADDTICDACKPQPATCDPVVATLVEAIELRALARFWRGNDPTFCRYAYRFARNRLAGLRHGDTTSGRWYVPSPC